MQLHPQELADQIFSQLSELSAHRDRVNEFTLKRIQHDAERIKSHDPVAAYTALGCIAFLRHDTEEMLYNHQKALKFNDYDFHSNINFAVSLSNAGYFGLAYEYGKKAFNIAGPEHVEAAKEFLNHCKSAGKFQEAAELMQLLGKMKIEIPKDNVVVDGLKFVNSRNIDPELISDYFCLSTEIMKKNDIYPKNIRHWHYEDEEEEYFIKEIFIEASSEDVAQMNTELSELVTKKNYPTDLNMAFCVFFTAR